MYKSSYDGSENKISISDDFVEIYKNFNVEPQIDRMNLLSNRELYLLLILVLDKFSDDDAVVVHNILPFKTHCMSIFDIQDDKTTTDQCLLDLIKETNDKYIDVSCLVDKNGNKLPEPLSKEEVRDAKINIINK